MKLFMKIQDWGNRHHPQWLDYFRMLLGIVLIWKGIDFYRHINVFSQLMHGKMLGTAVSISLMAHTIILAHIIGGLCIAIGTHTRFFCLVNLPIMIGAVFFINLSPEILNPYSEFWLSSLVLTGLLCFAVEGNGVIAVDQDALVT